VHRNLHRKDGTGPFVRDLSADLLAGAGRTDIVPDYHLERTSIPASQAAPVALILNDILSNAILHAYEGRHGSLRLAMTNRDGTCFVELSDLRFSPAEKADARDRSSGAIFNALVRQLQDKVEWPEAEPPVLVRMSFPLDF
jgi:two-component sensor histidine kinase